MEEILRLWTELGQQPTSAIFKNGLCKYPQNRFRERFGSWGNALHKFIEWVNAEGSAPTAPSEVTQSTKRMTSRDVNLRLRFKVILRDNFKCCFCGSSPANNPMVRLHVDHVIPWSRGGETFLENLQTLCQDCNLGKSDISL